MLTHIARERDRQTPPIVIFCISCITFFSSYLGGLATVSVPQISADLHLSPGMELWYVISKLSRTVGALKTLEYMESTTETEATNMYRISQASPDVHFGYRMHAPHFWRHVGRGGQ